MKTNRTEFKKQQYGYIPTYPSLCIPSSSQTNFTKEKKKKRRSEFATQINDDRTIRWDAPKNFSSAKRTAFTKKMVFQASHRHELINQKPLIPISTVTNQGDEIRMVQQTQHENLHNKFLKALKPITIKLFNCDNLPTTTNSKNCKRN